MESTLKIGGKYFVQTVTNYFVGELQAENEQIISLSKAAWIADTGRFADAMKSGEFSEIEPFPDGTMIFKSSVINISPFFGELPLKQK